MSGGFQWSSTFSSTSARKLTNKLFTYIHAWSPFFTVTLHSVERGTLRFRLHFGILGSLNSAFNTCFNTGIHSKPMTTENLFFLPFFVLFFFLFNILLTFLLFFLPQRKYKTNGKIRIWGFPEVGFCSAEARHSVCPAVMWESVLKCDCMCQRKGKRKRKKNRVFACVWACVCVRAC